MTVGRLVRSPLAGGVAQGAWTAWASGGPWYTPRDDGCPCRTRGSLRSAGPGGTLACARPHVLVPVFGDHRSCRSVRCSSVFRVGEGLRGQEGRPCLPGFRMVFIWGGSHGGGRGRVDVDEVEAGSAHVPRDVRHVHGGVRPSSGGGRQDGEGLGEPAGVGSRQDRVDGGGVVVAGCGAHGVRTGSGGGRGSRGPAVWLRRVDARVRRVEDRGGTPVRGGTAVGRVVPAAGWTGLREGAVPSDDGHAPPGRREGFGPVRRDQADGVRVETSAYARFGPVARRVRCGRRWWRARRSWRA